MKKVVFICLLQISMLRSYGQMTAPNWIHDDCNSVSHTLHSYLDSQEVVVMEFSMACISCTNAAGYLMDIKDEYAISHPGKVNFFLMDYYDTNDCTEVINMMSSYNFDAGFAGCMAEKNDYYPSAFPMPAIVIAAGNYHTVIFQTLGWVNSDTADIKQAIDQFFNTVGMENQSNNKEILMYPNPVDQMLYIDTKKYNVTVSNVSVFHITGNKVPQGILLPYMTGNFLQLSTGGLPIGTYVLEIITPTATLREIFVKT